MEQLLPVSTWGTTFATVSTPCRLTGDIVRVVASESNTYITLNPGGSSATINSMEYKDFDIPTDTNYLLQCSKACSVYLYAKSYDYYGNDCLQGGDPFLSTIPPIPLWASAYFISTIETTGFTFQHDLTIVIRTADKGGLVLDEAPLPASM